MSTPPPRTAPPRCATCRAAIAPREENPVFPFCSERCRLIDLGRWLDEDYRLPALDDEPPVGDDE